MVLEWALKQQKKLKAIENKIEGTSIKVSHVDETQYLPKPKGGHEIGNREQIITYPDGLVRDKDNKIMGVVEIESTIDPKKLAGNILATDAALEKEQQKWGDVCPSPFLIVTVKPEKKGKRKLNYIVEYAKGKQRCKCLADIQLCSVDKLEEKIRECIIQAIGDVK